MSKVSGGCLCGNINYELDGEILRAYHCHCKDCQRLSGTGHLSLLAINENSLKINGDLKYFEKVGDSGGKDKLGFCPECSSNILGVPENMPGMVAIAAGSLDDQTQFNPTIELFIDSSTHWDTLGAETIKFARLPK